MSLLGFRLRIAFILFDKLRMTNKLCGKGLILRIDIVLDNLLKAILFEIAFPKWSGQAVLPRNEGKSAVALTHTVIAKLGLSELWQSCCNSLQDCFVVKTPSQ